MKAVWILDTERPAVILPFRLRQYPLQQDTVAVTLIDMDILSLFGHSLQGPHLLLIEVNEVVLAERRCDEEGIGGASRDEVSRSLRLVKTSTRKGVDIEMVKACLLLAAQDR